MQLSLGEQTRAPIALDVSAILAYRHPQLIARYARSEGASVEEAERVFQETKKFLAVCAQTKGADFAPSEQQDAMWHHFILYTRDYMEFCATFFGRYLHHLPCEGARVQTDPCPLKLSAVTIFGEIASDLWPGRPTEMARCCGYC